MPVAMKDYEQLGAFYLGQRYDLSRQSLAEDLLLYDSKDLTTHAVIVGMTGSGKTGLGITLLEEAAIDGVPAIVIDPKGDMGNLLLNFPQMSAGELRPWLEKSEAARRGQTLDEYAEATARTWQNGLAQWHQPLDRIQRLRDAADVGIYTPGSDAGLQLSILKSLDAPPPTVQADADAFREHVSASVAGLLTLLDIDPDPLRSREFILLSNILEQAWRAGQNLDLPALIHQVQSPPFQKIGIMDLEAIYPGSARMQLAMTLNNVLASPGFASWTQGEPLNVARLLHTESGQPRLSVLSIAHLPDRERMFFVTVLLNDVLSWMRSQPGTSSLRALLYMDEVFGYLPPTANPPSKVPLLTLLKQARAFGLGVVLATQNPVDLDYKGLSNAGTWFLGRLQTERDKQRVLDGLEGASTASGVEFDRRGIEQTLSGLGSRVFLMNNVHEDAPVTFQTRWALSFLRGPLTRAQIEALMAERKRSTEPAAAEAASQPAAASPNPMTASTPATAGEVPAAEPSGPAKEAYGSNALAGVPPVLPAEIPQRYADVRSDLPRTVQFIYRPALLGTAQLHFRDAQSRSGIDIWKKVSLLASVERAEGDVWESASVMDADAVRWRREPASGVVFADLAGPAAREKSYSGWLRDLKDSLYRSHRLQLRHCPSLKLYSEPDESPGEFQVRLTQQLREERDLELEKLRSRYAPKIERLQDRIRKAEQRVEVERGQAQSATVSAALSFGTSLLGALFGRKLASSTNVSRAATSVRSASRAAQQRGDIDRAEEDVRALQKELKESEAELESETQRIRETLTVDAMEINDYEVKPRKSDIDADPVTLVWMPWYAASDGTPQPAW